MTKPKVFVTRRIPEKGLAKVRAACETEVWPGELPPPRSVLLERIGEVEGLLCLLTESIDAELLAAAAKLRVVSNFAVGVNNIDLAAAAQRGIKVGNTPGALTEATADIAFALMIAAARRIVEGDQYSRSGAWKTWEPLGHLGQDLLGKTVGVVGMGRIGYAFARRCQRGWDMAVLYFNRRETEWTEQARRELGARSATMDELLGAADFVSVHASLNAESKGMFNAAAFAKMKPTSVFINTARGPLHVQADLVAALKNRTIFAAGLDVTDPEPPEPTDELLKLSNLVVAPHIGSATVSSRDRMAEIAADNLLAGLAGRPLPHPVTP